MKENINLENIEVIAECDVLVCGAGPSGFTAAIAAARSGANTLLIERYGFPGGMLTSAFVNPIYGFFARHLQVVRGIAQEFVDELSLIPGATLGHQYRKDCKATRSKNGECRTGIDEVRCPVGTVAKVCSVDSEISKVVIMKMLETAKVQTIYHAWAMDTIVEDQKIQAVLINGKSGIQKIKPKVVIDTTGDADICAFSGVNYKQGFDERRITKPPTLMFKITGSDLEKDRIRINLKNTLAGEESFAWLMRLPEEGAYTVNAPSGILEFDSTNTISLSRAQEEATQRMFQLFTWIKENVKGCQNIQLHSIAANIGIRESRRIDGEYCLSDEDVLTSQKFPDNGIANGVHPIDLHIKNELFNNTHLIPARCGDYYQIPFGCLIPKGINNLLVAGRSISASFLAQGSLRVMATCMGMGQAAGTAAALMVKRGMSAREIDIQILREQLIFDGAYLGEENNVPGWNIGKTHLPDFIVH